MLCNICKAAAETFADAVILNKHHVQYYRCPQCGFVQTEEPYWLDEAYSRVIAQSDIGLLSRNLHLCDVTERVINAFFHQPQARFVDYGGGYGVFVRLMRDRGFDFHHWDPYCENLFACGLEAQALRDHYEALTAFEVFEHLAHPMKDIEKMFDFSANVLLTTELLPAHQPRPGDWWYYALETGQHVSFYTETSLRTIAIKFGRHFVSDGKRLHLFSTRRIPQWLFRLAIGRRVGRWLKRLRPRTSLLTRDYERLTGHSLT